jgi:hypothetical protein
VAAEIGVTIRPPSATDGAKPLRDPFAAIMQSSRLRARKVALRENLGDAAVLPLRGYG